MYQNLRTEMARAHVAKSEVARAMGKSPKSLWNRLNGQSPFTIPEAFAIRDRFFPGMSLDYLFSNGPGVLDHADMTARSPPG